MKKVFIFIDGSNFYFKLRDLTSKLDGKYSLIDFDFRKFAEWLIRPNELLEIRYYLGAIRRERNNSKSEQLYADQQKLIGKLQQQNIIITLGQLIKHPDKTYHEKGVDVRLAVEMIKFARENKYDIAYLVSSDTDLVAAVEEVRAFGKKVQYVGIPKGQSYGLSSVADDVRLLRSEEIEQFLPKSLV
ncbi:MAG TPA: NYN domain-containing protein [Candidatus Bathyarchaeia archaeon]|nr:NYN domain-containing protein [Candidatus Bathyarchaeia archaeon]